jgi:hypothetical protein
LVGDCSFTITAGTRFANPSNSAEAGEVVPAKNWKGCLDAHGRFRIRGLPATTGKYSKYTLYVVDRAHRYGARYLGDTPSSYRAEFVSVQAHRETHALDISLPRLATIGGTLYDAYTGAPLSNVCGITVTVYRMDPVTLCTDANGGYQVIGILTGPYVNVKFSPASTYEPHSWMSGMVFTLSAGEQRTDLDAHLVPIPGA